MDDTLEMPTAAPKPDVPQENEEEENSSGDEDQGPDWTKIPYAFALCSRVYACIDFITVGSPRRDQSSRKEEKKTLSLQRKVALGCRNMSSIARAWPCWTL